MTGNRRWRLSLIPVLAFLATLPVLVSLGIWQFQRGDAKRILYDQFERANQSAPNDATNASLDSLNEMARFERVQLSGMYLAEQQFLLDNMPRDGRPGHHVLTPFQPEHANHLVVVDRGWRPGLARDADAIPLPPVEERVVVAGMLAPFPRPAIRLEGIEATGDWPKVVQFPDADTLSDLLGRPVASSRLLLDDNAEGGFTRDWQVPGIPPERHYAYAFQWFSLAFALIVIFFVMAWPRPVRKSEEEAK